MKFSTTFLSLFAITCFMGCGKSTEKPGTESHEHRGEEAHEHDDNAAAKGNFKMQVAFTPQAVEAGKSAAISLTPKNTDNNSAVVPLEVQHEKKIHLIIVSEDLSWFRHIHPEFNADGSYKVDEIFPSGGNYILYADYKPSGADHQLEKTTLNVSGKTSLAKTFTTENTLYKSTDGISLQLKADDGIFFSGKEIHFDGIVSENGKPVDVHLLDNFLGAKAHAVVIESASKSFLHVHPEVENTILHFHVTFAAPGIHRAWVQFSYKGKVHTTEFTLNVQKGKTEASTTEHDHNSEHSH